MVNKLPLPGAPQHTFIAKLLSYRDRNNVLNLTREKVHISIQNARIEVFPWFPGWNLMLTYEAPWCEELPMSFSMPNMLCCAQLASELLMPMTMFFLKNPRRCLYLARTEGCGCCLQGVVHPITALHSSPVYQCFPCLMLLSTWY